MRQLSEHTIAALLCATTLGQPKSSLRRATWRGRRRTFHERIWTLIPWGKRPGKRGKDAHFVSSRIEMDFAANFYPVGRKNPAIIASTCTYVDSQKHAGLSSSSVRSINQVAGLE